MFAEESWRAERAGELESWRAGELESWRAGELRELLYVVVMNTFSYGKSNL